MSKRSDKSRPPEPRPRPRLFLITPPGADAAFAARIAEACAAGDVASVLVWGEAGEGNAHLQRAKALVPAIQAGGAAALLRADPQLVGRAGADGFHADGDAEDLAAAIADLSPDRIVGAANLRSRHDAMAAGEAGADYVFFGNPAPGAEHGNAPTLLLERAEWWQSIFEVPCVVLAPSMDAVGPLAMAGADFVALSPVLWAEGDTAGAIRAAMAAIDAASREVA